MKSTWTKIRIVQMVLQNPMGRILLVSRTAALSETMLADVRRMLATPLLRRYFPELIPEPGKKYGNWEKATADAITLTRKEDWGRIPQEAQIEACGVGKTITGRHYDVIVCDDILNEESVRTPEQNSKVHEYFAYLQAIIEPDGYFYVIGTRYLFTDLYGTIIKNNWFGKRVFVRSAIEDGRSIYKFFTLKMLHKMKVRMGPFAFSCQMMNQPIPKEEQIFHPPFSTFDILPDDQYDWYITVDPAATVESYSDQTAIVVAAVNASSNLWIVEALGMKKPSNELADILIRLCVKYRPKRVGIELNLQQHFRAVIEMKLDQYNRLNGSDYHMPIEPITVSRKVSKADRVNRSLGAFYRDGRLHIHTSAVDLMRQMEVFPKSDNDDLVDATAMLFMVVDRFAGRYWSEQQEYRSRVQTYFDLFRDDPRNRWADQFVS